MNPTLDWTRHLTSTDGIAGERRDDRRYDLNLELRWRLIRRRRVLDAGVGHTLDLSSGGILFHSNRHMPVGLNVELNIAWPVLLYDMAPLQLFVTGRVVRNNGPQTAIRMIQHEFRTLGAVAGARNAATETRPPSYLLMGDAPVFAAGKLQ